MKPKVVIFDLSFETDVVKEFIGFMSNRLEIFFFNGEDVNVAVWHGFNPGLGELTKRKMYNYSLISCCALVIRPNSFKNDMENKTYSIIMDHLEMIKQEHALNFQIFDAKIEKIHEYLGDKKRKKRKNDKNKKIIFFDLTREGVFESDCAKYLSKIQEKCHWNVDLDDFDVFTYLRLKNLAPDCRFRCFLEADLTVFILPNWGGETFFNALINKDREKWPVLVDLVDEIQSKNCRMVWISMDNLLEGGVISFEK